VKVHAIKAPGFGENRKANLQDLAAVTGGQLISEDLGLKLEIVKPDMLGSAKRVTVSKDDIIILDGGGDKKDIEEQCEQIGGASEIEVNEKKDHVTDALNATKAAVEEGIVPGGGVALLYASRDLDKLSTTNFDQKVGVQIIQNALKMPTYTIAANADVEGAVMVGKLLE